MSSSLPTTAQTTTVTNTLIFSRLAAAVYDAFLLLAVWLMATAIAIGFRGGKTIPPGEIWYQIYLILVMLLFFTFFWWRGGQTLGMKAWHLRVVRPDQTPILLQQSLLRSMAMLLTIASLGVGFLWIIYDKKRRTWHDIIANTIVVRNNNMVTM
ncbi:MAG: RDD family protein [Gammaproteobacteria bacterium]|nr:RDD family protein [Gammaproteobacteria bacterium]